MAKIGRPKKGAEVIKLVKVDGRDINSVLTRDQRLHYWLNLLEVVILKIVI
jgi:hypothetical protein